ncbi:MAG: hypothetical protein ACE144_03305 [Thermodesulfobacteriota bacterium]
MNDKRKEETMSAMKAGEIWLNSITGGIYKIRDIINQMVILQSVRGANQILTSKECLNLFYVMVPREEDSRFPSERGRPSPAVRRIEEPC